MIKNIRSLLKLKSCYLIITENPASIMYITKKQFDELNKTKHKISKEVSKKIKNKNIIPKILYLEITGNCNLKCQHCIAIKSRGNELDFSDLMKIIDDFAYIKGKKIILSGGEPTLHSQIEQIIEYCYKKDLKVILKTNAALRISKKLLELGNLFSCHISLEGASAKTNDIIRGKGSFDKIINGINNLVRSNINLDMLSIVLNKYNKHEIEGIADLGIKYGFKSISYSFLTSEGSAEVHYSKYSISDKEKEEALHSLYKLRNKNLNKIVITGPIFDNIELIVSEGGEYFDFNCSAGSIIKVDSSQNIFPCPYFSNPKFAIGNLNKVSLINIVENGTISNIYKNIHSRRYEISKCMECNYRDFCGSGCMADAAAMYGDINSPDNWCNVRKNFYNSIINDIWKKKFREC